MKLGLDIHGVIDRLPVLAELATLLVSNGHEVHIITGAPWNSISDGNFSHDGIEEYLEKYGFIKDKNFTHFFSIVDYHRELGTEITCDANGCWLDSEKWNIAKSIYCTNNKIDLHLDDSIVYSKSFTTPFALIV